MEEEKKSFLSGHKTQIAGAATLIAGFCINKGYVDAETGNLILSLLGIAFGLSVTHSEVKKSKSKKNY